MGNVVNVVMLLVGFVLLILGADRFVEGASELAKRLRIPSVIIGLTIVAFGTSAPELAVSVVAGLQGANEIAIGNVLGSNIFNLLVVIGCSTIAVSITVEKELLHRDWGASIAGTILLGVLLLLDYELSRVDGVILLCAFTFVIGAQIRSGIKVKYNETENGVEKENIQVSSQMQVAQVRKIMCGIIGGLTCIILGGQFAVTGASEIARILNISETIIGLTVVAIGTSLPELVTSVVATKKGETSIAIGNVIGSNLFNILFILGVSAVCNPIAIQMTAIYDIVILFIISVVMYCIGKKDRFNRGIGVGMLLIYVTYTLWILVR